MQHSKFVHLHLHTDFSLLDGANEISQLMRQAEKLKMPALAMTDHGNLYGTVSFYETAMKHGIKPIIGCEMYVAKESRHGRNSPDGEKGLHHLTVLAENDEGYRNLVKLCSSAFLEGFYYKPRVDKELFAKHHQGLIALSGCLNGEVAYHIQQDRLEEAARAAAEYRDLFGPKNFFLEIQFHGLEKQRRVNPHLVELSRRLNVPLVATNDCHYLRPEDARAHDILLCIGTGSTVNETRRMRYDSDQFYLKSDEEMLAAFSDMPDAVSRTVEIAERCNFLLEKIQSPFPRFDVPKSFTADAYFEKVVRDGFQQRLEHLQAKAARGLLRHPIEEYHQRLNREIEMIKQLRFPSYFLIVWDFIRYARERGIPIGPGRGSAAGSLVAYALQITDIDPLQYELLFERFLNPERVNLPDIDIDFCMKRRNEVIDYVTAKYGREHVSQIVTFGTMGAKAAIKDVGRAMEMPYAEVDKIAKLVPNQLHITLEEALKRSAPLRELYEKDPKITELLNIAKKLEGLARHASVHAAGIVISPKPLLEVVPLSVSSRREGSTKEDMQQVVTQFEMSDLEKLGLLKMDFLALATLTIIEETVRLIERFTGEKLVMEDLPLDDAETYQLFSDGLTNGVFQFESSGMRDILLRYRPNRFEDLIALNALYRPGTIQGGMIDEFIRRKHGESKITYDLPELTPILEETYGVMVYQEQVMQIAIALAGFTLGEADLLRRAMGKKLPEEMKAQKEKFLAGARAKKIPERKAEKIFNFMEQFAGYGFNKSHSAAYALLAYQTAYLKRHYPVYFMSSLLTNEMGNSDKIVKYINECRDWGLEILPPDINQSDLNFTPAGENRIRFGLAAIKNVGENAIRAILDARSQGGPFQSIFDFCERVDSRSLNKRMLESLVKSGSFDSLNAKRSQLSAVIDQAMEGGQKAQRDRESGQAGLFALAGSTSAAFAPAHEKLPPMDEWQEHILLTYEKETLGFFITGHPLAKYADELSEFSAVTIETVQDLESGREVTLGGIVVNLRTLRTRKGDRMAAVVLEDLSGTIEVVVFPEPFRLYESTLRTEEPIVVKGRVDIEESGKAKILASEIWPIKNMRETLARKMIVHVNLTGLAPSAPTQLLELFEKHRGKCELLFELEHPRQSLITLKPDPYVRVKPSTQLIKAIEAICGIGSVKLVA